MMTPLHRLASGAVVTVLALTAPLASAAIHAQEIESSYFTTPDGLRIHYFEIDGQGTPVVLIHGYTANAEGKWIKPGIAQALAANGHRVVAVDARGHGLSDKPHDPTRYGPRMAEDVVHLMDELDIERAHVHGFSMGGSLLTQILRRHPERVITAIYGGSGVTEVDPAWVARVPPDPEAPEGTAADLPFERWSTYPGFDRTALNALQDYPWTDEERAIDLTRIDLPVLAIIGGYDGPNRRTHRMARELSDFELVVLPGETHGSSHFNPRYTEALIRFIGEHDPGQ